MPAPFSKRAVLTKVEGPGPLLPLEIVDRTFYSDSMSCTLMLDFRQFLLIVWLRMTDGFLCDFSFIYTSSFDCQCVLMRESTFL